MVRTTTAVSSPSLILTPPVSSVTRHWTLAPHAKQASARDVSISATELLHVGERDLHLPVEGLLRGVAVGRVVDLAVVPCHVGAALDVALVPRLADALPPLRVDVGGPLAGLGDAPL